MTNKQPVLVKGTVLLALSALIVKLLSAVYRVPFQNIVGDEGFYVFQQVYPIYGIASVMALEGFPVFLSKLVAAETDNKRQLMVVKQVQLMVKVVAFLCFALLFLGAPWFAKEMGDARLSGLIRSTSLLFLLVPALTFYRGYYQGILQLEKTAVSQVVEQLLRVFIIVGAAYLFKKELLNDVYHASGLASMGAFVGAIFALIWLKKDATLKNKTQAVTVTFDRQLLYRFVTEGGLICLFAGLLVIFQLVDAFVMKNALVANGMTEMTAKVIKGAYDRGQPLAQLGLVVSTALAMAQLPRLTLLRTTGVRQDYFLGFKQLLKVMIVLGSAATVGLISLLPELNRGLFGDTKESVSIALFLGVVLIVGVIQMFQIFAQADNRSAALFSAFFIGLLIKAFLSYPLVFRLGSLGASFATLLGLGGMLIWLVVTLYPRGLKQPPFMLKLISCLVLMSLSIILFRKFWLLLGLNPLTSRTASLLFVLISVIIGIIVFVSGIILLKVFTTEEYAWLPLEKYLEKLRRKKL